MGPVAGLSVLSWLLPAVLAAAEAPPVRVVEAMAHKDANAQAVAFSPDGRLVAAGFGGPSHPEDTRTGGVAVWEAATGKLLWRHSGEYGDIIGLGFSPDGRSLAYARIHTPGDSVEDHVVRLLDVADGKVRLSRHDHNSFVFLSKSGELLLPSSGVCLGLADLKPTRRIEAMQAEGGATARLPDGVSLVLTDRRAKPVKEIRDGKEVKITYLVHALSVYDLAAGMRTVQMDCSDVGPTFGKSVSPDGKWLAAGHTGGIVRLRSLPDLAEVRTLQLDTGRHLRPVFSPDGRTLLVAVQAAGGPRWTYDGDAPGGFDIRKDADAAGCDVVLYATDGFKEVSRLRFRDGSFSTHYFRFGRPRRVAPQNPEYNPPRFVWSPDGRHVLAGCNGVVLVDPATGKVVRQFHRE